MSAAIDFIRQHTTLAATELVPEIKLHLATEITPMWQASEDWLSQHSAPPPFWAFAWPGGQALARYMLDNPALVSGKTVLDFAAGSGLAAITAMRAGARKALAADIDPLAQEACLMNAAQNGVAVEIAKAIDLKQPYKKADVILAGDVCYEQAMSASLLRWLRLCVSPRCTVILADPGRAYAPDTSDPQNGYKKLAHYKVPVSRELEDRDIRNVTIWQLVEVD